MKRCRLCAEDIQDAAIVCKHCGRELMATIRRILAASIAVLAIATATYAQPTGLNTGNDLLRMCRGAVDPSVVSTSEAGYDAIFCMGFVHGLEEAHTLISSIQPGAKLFCIPAGVTLNQLVRVIVKYLQDRPEDLHDRGVLLAVGALARAFPCPAK